jgi:hypothetical protein
VGGIPRQMMAEFPRKSWKKCSRPRRRGTREFFRETVATAYDGGSADLKHIKKKSAILVGENLEI